MSTVSLNSLSNPWLQSLPGAANQTSTAATGVGSILQQADTSSLSPLGQLAGTLRELQQSDPAKYREVTGQIAANLKTAARTALSQGNTGAATQLNQLASDFSDASTSGQIPKLQDLAHATGGHHHHHGHAHATPADPDSSSTTGSQSSATDPLSIISKALTDAGVTNASTGTASD